MNKLKKMKMKSEKMRIALRAVALVLLLGAGLGQIAAQPLPNGKAGKDTREEEDKGYVMDKTVNEAGDLLTLESYVTGKTITTTVTIPADIVLVLDASGTMDERVKKLVYSLKYASGQAMIRTIAQSSSYYIKVGDEYHRLIGYYQINKPYSVTDEVTGEVLATAPYGSENKFNYDVYEQKEESLSYTKGQAMKDAVKNFITLTQQKAQNDSLSHRIAIVKFSGSNATTLKGLTTLTDDNVTQLKSAVENISFSDGSPVDEGVKNAAALLTESSYGAEKSGSVIVFSDGEPNHSGGFIPKYAANAINYAKPLKQKGVKVFSLSYDLYTNTEDVVSHPTSKNQAKNTFMASVSSNYPTASSSSTSTYTFNNNFDVTLGDRAEGEFYKYADLTSMEKLNEVFTEISKAIGGADVKWDEQSIVRDVVSKYFQLPAGTTTDNIVVKTDACTGLSDGKPTFANNPQPFAGDVAIRDTIVKDVDNQDVHCNVVQVTNFNFSDNWCGIESDSPRGKKLIIEIPIEQRPGIDPGMHYTNEPGSHIIPHVDPEGYKTPTENFPVPELYVKGATWVEAIHENPGEAHIKKISGTYHIYTKEGLAWFISIVCGYNGQEPDADANAVLEADVDMTEGYIQGSENLGIRKLIWVPIGGYGFCRTFQDETWTWSYPDSHGYSGTFDGQGHTIRGMRNPDPVSVPQVGMFGYVNGGTVKNVFVVDCEFKAAVGRSSSDKLSTGTIGHFGIIADTLCNGGQIFDCEAAGLIRTYDTIGKMFDDSDYNVVWSPSQDPTQCFIGGLVGLVGRDKQGEDSPATVHSCISVANVMGFKMGGAAYEIAAGSSMKNCYDYSAHLEMTEPETHPQTCTYSFNFGGLVGLNAGTVENCYLRERDDIQVKERIQVKVGDQIHDENRFHTLFGIAKTYNAIGNASKGILFGQNTSTAQYIYVPEEWNNTTDFVGTGTAASIVSKFNATVTPYLYRHHDNCVSNLVGTNAKIPAAPKDGLLQTLNAWVEGTGCTPWMRTAASSINDDYPVLNIDEFQYVAADGVAAIYGYDVNEMLADRMILTEDKDDDVIYLYKNANLTVSNTDDNAPTLYIDEKVAVTQTEDVNAYVGITLDNSAGINGANSNHPYYGFAADTIDWHMFATPLADAPLGIDYADDETPYPFSYTPGDIPQYSFYDESDFDGYFPSKSFDGSDYYHDWDFYCWNEKYYHYINFKRNSNSHWTEGHDLNLDLHSNIPYTNETNLIPGKGYMLAVANETFLQSHGTLNNGDLTTNVTCSDNPFCPGYNLIGNPYQSYLDFDEFASENGINTYAILDEDARAYISYTAGSTGNPLRYVNMHQGFFVKVTEGGTVKFTNDMRDTTATATTFRGGEAESYPHLKLTLTEDNGMRDYARVEFDRPELGGGEKLKDLRAGNAQIYLHNGDTDYSTLFATSDFDEVALRFKTLADGTYTLAWELSDGDFSEMYLVDNINGQKTDMLAHSSYKFEGRSSDYASRFRVVFGLNDSEDEGTEAETGETFAFQMDGCLVVNGQGTCQVFDLTGRMVGMAELTDSQSTLPLPQVNGIYVVRLAGNKEVKVQKIVVRQ